MPTSELTERQQLEALRADVDWLKAAVERLSLLVVAAWPASEPYLPREGGTEGV